MRYEGTKHDIVFVLNPSIKRTLKMLPGRDMQLTIQLPSPADKNLQLMLQTYTYAERESEPTGHLDVIPGALAFTALLPRLELPFLSGTIFTISMDAHELQEFVTKAIDSPDADAVLALIGKETARTNALQLFRNFCDCDKLEYSPRPMATTFFSFFTWWRE